VTDSACKQRTILKGYKTELRPNKRARAFMGQHCGAARHAYNWALRMRSDYYKRTGQTLSLSDLQREFRVYKKQAGNGWLLEVTDRATEAAIRHLHDAYVQFWTKIPGPNGQPRRFPKPRRRRGGGRFTLMILSRHVQRDRIRLGKIGWVRLKQRDYLPADCGKKNITASVSEVANRWFVSVLCPAYPKPTPRGGGDLAVHPGVRNLSVRSDGVKAANPKALEKAQRRLRTLNRELARRKRGGQNWKRTRQKIRKLHYRIACIRRNATHEMTTAAARDSGADTVVVQKWDVAGMAHTSAPTRSVRRTINRYIADANFYEQRRQLQYKSDWYGADYLEVPPAFPASKRCSACGQVKKEFPLWKNDYRCEECGLAMDRDENAALNLLEGASRARLEGGET